MNYEDMSDFEINKWIWRLTMNGRIMRCADYELYSDEEWLINFDPCNNPSDAWPIIVDNFIWVQPPNVGDKWVSYGNEDSRASSDKNPLRAAMICFLKMKDAEKCQQ